MKKKIAIKLQKNRTKNKLKKNNKKKKKQRNYTIPCAFIASTTFSNPAMFAPAT